jgi:CRP-like cAMP-binding protein
MPKIGHTRGLVYEMNDPSEVRENQLLAALPAESLERLLPSLENILLPPGEILLNFEDELTHLYFPKRNTIVSLVCRGDEDVGVGIGLCGNEGTIGMLGLLGAETTPQQSVVQVPGSASRLNMAIARNEFRLGGRFQELMLMFMHVLFIQVAQTALCNRIHSDEERLARWLLLSNERIESNQLPLPPELLAKLLGRNLSSFSLTAGILQRAGFIAYNGRELTILDRELLESVACNCYWVVRRQAARVLEAVKAA